MLKLIIYASCFLLLFVMTLFLLKSNDNKKSTKIFTFLVSVSLFWLVSLWITDSTASKNIALIFINLAVFFFTAVTWLLLYFSFSYNSPKKQGGNPVFVIVAILYNLFYFIAAILHKIVTTIHIGSYGASIIDATSLYGVHVLQSNGFAVLALIILNIKKRKFDETSRKQVSIMTGGLVVAAIGNILSGTIASYFKGLTWLNLIGVLSTAIFIAMIGYAVVKHKLFDIRAIVARSIAYLLTIAVAASLYGVIIFIVGNALVGVNTSESVQRIFYAFMAIVVAMTFQSMKRFFDKATNRLFYQDAYDTQLVLDKVSSVIVGNVDPHKVQRGALLALSDAVRPTYMAFLLSNGGSVLHDGDAIGQSWSSNDLSLLQETLKRIGKGLVVYDELQETKTELREVLRSEDISVVSPLVTKDETIGYLILGPKKSGNIYNSQDIGLLNIASNELAVALQNAQRFEEIQAFNITLQEKVTDATRELKRTNKKLIALDEAKDEFISMASHQLRTPLTSIKGYISMLLEGDLGKIKPQQERALKEAFGSSQRMVFLIADFLNVSRIKTGKFIIELKEVDLPQVVNEEITQLKEMAQSRDITLAYDPPGTFPHVKLDDNKIRQVMMNMVDNAIYYTPAEGTVTIQLYIDGSDVVFKVTDTGIGVPKREQHKLFTKFFRAGNARKARPDGTGLGLFMAQKIIVEQGGSIIFESTEGKGSTFGFRFPLSKIKA